MRRIALLATIAALTAACTRVAEEPAASPTSPTPTPTATSQRTATIYFLLESLGRVYLVPEEQGISGDAAVAELQAVVDAAPQDPDLFSPWPEGARVLGIAIEHGTAIVDWNAEVLEATEAGAEVEMLAIQQAVWTLTELPGIERVEFTVEGLSEGEASNGRTVEDWWGHVGLAQQPFARADADVLAPITIERPAEGEEVSGTIIVSGEASTFEAHVAVRLKDAAGGMVSETFTTASEGAPGRGTWSKNITIPVSAQAGETWIIEGVEVSEETGDDFFVMTRSIAIEA